MFLNYAISLLQLCVVISIFIQEEINPSIEIYLNSQHKGRLPSPDPLIQLTPSIEELLDEEILHESCRQIF
jgi:hypothetical protein